MIRIDLDELIVKFLTTLIGLAVLGTLSLLSLVMTDLVAAREIVNLLFVYGFLAVLVSVFLLCSYRFGMAVLYIVLVADKDSEEDEAARGDSGSK